MTRRTDDAVPRRCGTASYTLSTVGVTQATAKTIAPLSDATNTVGGDQHPDPARRHAAGHSDKLDKSVLIVAGVVVLGAIMSILDITVVSVALKTFQNEFNATAAEVAWTMTGYTLALASVIPLTGWAADRFGTKRLYLLAVVLFTAGSVLCAAATASSSWSPSGSSRASAAAC